MPESSKPPKEATLPSDGPGVAKASQSVDLPTPEAASAAQALGKAPSTQALHTSLPTPPASPVFANGNSAPDEGTRVLLPGEFVPGPRPPATAENIPQTLTWGATPADATAQPTRLRERVVQVPGYQILSKLGEGGMGVVYKAVQLKANRIVALKMLSSGMASQSQIDRFMVEAKAAAGLDHANIVGVFEVGEVDGLPYFSMEHCPGGSLSSQLHGTPLRPRLAAEIIKSLAEALQAAHANGVVHRDLKPANVLLAPNPGYHTSDWARVSYQGLGVDLLAQAETPPSFLDQPHAYIPKIADFGLAKLVDADATQTRTGAVMGTPSYMAPEQAQGAKNIGPLADVYALGAILFEFLTGRPPFVTSSSLETLKKVVEEEPRPPTHFEPRTPRDLETICLKCLEKKPERRYGSAMELAEDLGRFLRGEPIHARPAGALERGIKWVRRRPALATIYLLAAALLVLLAIFNWRLTAQRNRAHDNFTLAMAAVDQFLTQVSENPILKEHAFEELRGELLQGAVSFLEKFVEIEGADDALLAEQARACMRLALIQKSLEHRSEAIALNEKALGLFAGLGSNEPGAERDRATVHQRLGNLHAERGDYDQALREFQESLARRKRLAELPETTPLDKVQLARTWNSLGFLHDGARKNTLARDSFARALDVLKPLAVQPSVDAVVQDALAQTYYNLAVSQKNPLQAPKEARDHFELAIQAWETLPRKTEYQVKLAEALGGLGNLLVRQQTLLFLGEFMRQPAALDPVPLVLEIDRRQALAAHERARDIWEEQIRKHPSVQSYQAALARCWYNMAALLDRSRAAAVIQKAVEVQQALQRTDPTSNEYRSDLARYLKAQVKSQLLQGKQLEAARSLIALARLSGEEERLAFGLRGCTMLVEAAEIDEAVSHINELAAGFTKGSSFCHAAKLLARAARTAGNDTKLADRCAAACLEMLEKASGLGHFRTARNLAELESFEEWRFLQARQDFQAFLKRARQAADTQK